MAEAYLAHFAPEARAVVQLRGVARVLTARHSAQLFALLQSRVCPRARIELARLAPCALAAGSSEAWGGFYINVTHTDFDLPRHREWAARLASCLRPDDESLFYRPKSAMAA